MPVLSDHVRSARHRQFVGRDAERARFASALMAPVPPFHILYVYGPGGVGKTALLREFQLAAEAVGVPCLYLDGRDVEASIDVLVAELDLAMEIRAEATPGESRRVLLIDTFEALAVSERSFRDRLLAHLPADVILVLAGQQAPAPAWRVDAGLRQVTCLMPLRNLDPAASRCYLNQRRVPEAQVEAVLNFTHGHPLALSVVADAFDQQPDLHFSPARTPDLVGTLLDLLVQEVSDAECRAALEACALVRNLTEGVLAAMLERDDVHDLFRWLRTLSFIEAGADGLFPHDLVREVLKAELQWRHAERHWQLLRNARHYYTRLLQEDTTRPFDQVLADYLFLYRDNPIVRPLFRQLKAQWQEAGGWQVDAVRRRDWSALVDMVDRFEEADSVALVSYWMERLPDAFRVFHAAAGEPAGFFAALPLHEVTPEDEARDPVVAAACEHLRAHAPLRAGEAAFLFRFWMDGEHYQGISPVQGLFFVETIRLYLTTPRLIYTFLPCAEPSFWGVVFSQVGLQRLPEAGFKAGNRSFSMFGRDWRQEAPSAWLERLAEDGLQAFSAEAARPSPSTLLVLSREDFQRAVKDALRNFAHPLGLSESPLARSRFVLEQAGAEADAEERVTVLRSLLREAASVLKESPRHAKAYHALRHTYLEPEPTQEKVAELLGMPFSTYRRHLKASIAAVTERLWRQEVGP